jgi:hypothetical protein
MPAFARFHYGKSQAQQINLLDDRREVAGDLVRGNTLCARRTFGELRTTPNSCQTRPDFAEFLVLMV